MHRRFPLPYAAVALACTLHMAACSVFEDDDDDRTTVTDMSPYGNLPPGAIRVASGFDTVRYRASEPARIWVGNDSRRQVITDTRVQPGDEIVVDTGGDRVTVNGMNVYNQNLEKNEQHSIFIVPERVGG